MVRLNIIYFFTYSFVCCEFVTAIYQQLNNAKILWKWKNNAIYYTILNKQIYIPHTIQRMLGHNFAIQSYNPITYSTRTDNDNINIIRYDLRTYIIILTNKFIFTIKYQVPSYNLL